MLRYPRPVFKNAQGRFDGKIFMGVCLGLGTAAGLVIKLWITFDGDISPFWMWAIPSIIIAVGLSVWLSTRRRDNQIRERIERSRRVERKDASVEE